MVVSARRPPSEAPTTACSSLICKESMSFIWDRTKSSMVTHGNELMYLSSEFALFEVGPVEP